MPTVERARPLLGTIVAVRADAADDAGALAAVEAAFAELAIWHERMSAQSGTSDVTAIGRLAAGAGCSVDPRTATCLIAALELASDSGGVFDPVVPGGDARWQDLDVSGDHVRVARPLRVDLSGIAKGGAVDDACDALVQAGARSGMVNAGGDLRVFGGEMLVDLAPRHSAAPARLRIADGALASSDVAAGDEDDGAPRHWDGRDGGSVRPRFVSVVAPLCRDADALTKVAIVLGRDAGPLLTARHAIAYSHEPGSGWRTIGDGEVNR